MTLGQCVAVVTGYYHVQEGPMHGFRHLSAALGTPPLSLADAQPRHQSASGAHGTVRDKRHAASPHQEHTPRRGAHPAPRVTLILTVQIPSKRNGTERHTSQNPHDSAIPRMVPIQIGVVWTGF